MDIVSDLRAIVGDDGVLNSNEASKRSAGAFRPDNLNALALVRPANTEEVSKVLRYCSDNNIKVVTQGGLTGLVRGADARPDELILSTERLRKIEEINPIQRTATVQAGVLLQTLQEAVEKYELTFPLDLGARGSATVGGNAATNAGGNRVIRYGMMRDMVLGLEVVLADGTIISSLNGLLKNNTGYDIKQLFVGSEGTLGVITRLVLRLREKPRSSNVALVAVQSFQNLTGLLKFMDRELGGSLSAFEVMWQDFYKLVTTEPAKGRPPISQDYPYYVLIESQGSNRESDTARFSTALEMAAETELIVDAAISQSDSDCHAFWSLRDDVAQVIQGGMPVVFDISLPIENMEEFVSALKRKLPYEVGPHKLWVYGHLGDGNLHVNVQIHPLEYFALRPKIESCVYHEVKKFNGSVSAEHGIGLEKKPHLNISRNAAEINLMRMIKNALDPDRLLNPGKIF